ncbi:hypothetical protein G9A89_019015 [Geosiphon pyriformis]|nr:hypothetical protein G9A89_019015 [Geosiphon pyriformis]
MITPVFNVEQDNDFITIIIHAPFIKAQDVEFFIENNEFKFYLRPYFLRLRFPGNIVEDDRSKASYDIAKGDVIVKLPKETPGEQFPDLDLVTKLMARKGEYTHDRLKSPLIEAVGKNEGFDKMQKENLLEYEEAIHYDWELPQEFPSQPDLILTTSYGFNGQYNGYFTYVQETCNEINDIPDPEISTFESRRQIRLAAENPKFDDEYYMGDFVYDEEVKEIIKHKTVWWKELRQIQNLAKAEYSHKEALRLPDDEEKDSIVTVMKKLEIGDVDGSNLKFTKQEQDIMRNLPNKEYLIDNEKSIYLGLIDLIFAYSYNKRVTEDENTVESVWTIGKLSPTISCLEKFTTLKETIVALYRRALAYPLYRNYALCEKVLQDVYVVFKLGKRALLKCLLEIKDLFDHHDAYYIYSKIWLDDYCVWCMKTSDVIIRSLAHELHHFNLPKSEIGWNLEELEQLATEQKDDS